MKKEFSEIQPGNRLLINLSNGNKTMEIGASLVRHLKNNIALISLDNPSGQALKFDNMTINIVYTSDDGTPYIWTNSTIVVYQGQYLLQVKANGGQQHNRRNSYRVGVSHYAKLRRTGYGSIDVVVRDISLTGFSIADRARELHLEQGTHVYLQYEDIGYNLDLEGNVVRVEETEECTIYGFVLTKSSKDLSAYVNMKHRKKN